MRNYSIYLVVIIAAGVLMLFFPISTVRISASGFEEKQQIRIVEITAFSNTEVLSQNNPHTGKNIMLPATIILCILNSLVVIFLAKDNSVRARLCGLNYVFICVTIVLIFYYCDFQTSLKNILVESDYHAGAMMPFLQLLFNFGAIRKIRRGNDSF